MMRIAAGRQAVVSSDDKKQKEGHLMQKERITTNALLICKSHSPYYQIPGRVPEPQQIYELCFSTPDGEKTFEVSSWEYDCVEERTKGTLVYEGSKLISFADAIKEYHME